MSKVANGQETTTLIVDNGALMRVQITPAPGRIVTILRVDNGSQPQMTHQQGTLLPIQSEYSMQLMNHLVSGHPLQMKLMVVCGSRLMAPNMEVGPTTMSQIL